MAFLARDFDRYLLNDSTILKKMLTDASKLPDYHPIGDALLRIFARNASEMMLLKCCVVNEMEVLEKKEDPFRLDSLRSYILAEYLARELDPLITTLCKMLVKTDGRKTKITPPKGKKDATSPRHSHGDDAIELTLAVELINYLKGDNVQFSNDVILILSFVYEVAKEEVASVDPFNVVNSLLFLRTICPGIIRKSINLQDTTRKSVVNTVRMIQSLVNTAGLMFNFYHQKILGPRDNTYIEDVSLLYNAYCQTMTLAISRSDGAVGRENDMIGRLAISPSAPL